MEIINANIEKFYALGLLFTCSIYIRVLLQIMGQAWIKTIAHTATLSLLPILTYVITSVISGNIALSLGMVGALSIVRFRNPVRSPLELSVYFGAITMGITAAVNLQWLILLIGSVSIVSFALYMINILTNALSGNPFFIASFSEGNALSTLYVKSSSSVNILDRHDNLTSKNKDGDQLTYTIASGSFKMLKSLEESINDIDCILSIQLNK
jgi:hypothetical protein